MFKSAIVALALAGAVSGAADAPTATVKLSAVNFRNAADVDRLYGQLQRSAEAVCDSNSANPRITQMDRACARKALARAVRTADRPTLTARYESANPSSAFASQDY
jgi:UrcA family protein